MPHRSKLLNSQQPSKRPRGVLEKIKKSMVVKRELNAQGNVKTMSSTLQSKIAAITIKMGNINDVIKEFEQNIAGIQTWRMVTHRLWVIV